MIFCYDKKHECNQDMCIGYGCPHFCGSGGKPTEQKKTDTETKRAELLEAAKKCICSDRDIQYGSPENSFNRIAEYWSVYLGYEISAKDVGLMMALFKIARINTGHEKDDNYIDCIGYVACAGEVKEKEHENKT